MVSMVLMIFMASGLYDIRGLWVLLCSLWFLYSP